MSDVDRIELAHYATVTLTASLAGLTESERAIIPLLVEAADLMDDIYWLEAFGPPDELLETTSDPSLRRQVEINCGPWDRKGGDAPMLPGIGERPKGARFYPEDMTAEEFEAAAAGPDGEALRSLYTLVRRDDRGRLVSVPYHNAFEPQVRRAADLLRAAAARADDAGLRRYLDLRATALETDDYRASDIAWLDMKSNTIEFVIGPIETYDDKLFGYKASHQAILLVRDADWSRRLAGYVAMLPSLQAGLPVPDEYRRETPGAESDLNAYDALYLAGDTRVSRPIGITLPNDEEIQLEKGARRLQIMNMMRAKFEAIEGPIADELIAEDQRDHVTFEAMFEDVMFHELAHGLGIKQTIDGRSTVHRALKDVAAPIEEQKADVVGLFMLERLAEQRREETQPALDRYVSHLAGLFRLLRFGGTDPYTASTASQFDYFSARGGIVRDASTGTYRVDAERMSRAVEELARRLLVLQGDGDHEGAVDWLASTGVIGRQLRADLDRLDDAHVPVDVVFDNPLDLRDRRGP